MLDENKTKGMQTKLIPLTDIEPLRNYREVVPVSAKDPDVIELAGTMKQHGQLQACLVRLHPKKDGKYQLYIGFRRLMAAGVAGLQSLKCEVKEIPDDDILELQVIENMQRKDPHPMDEAVAYKTLMEKRKWTVQETADRFGKKADYITQRLKLNDLVPDLQKDFKENKMLLGHALLLCRLTPADQAAAKKQATGKDFRNESVHKVKEWIDEQIMHDLSKVSWDINDKTLLPSAGACSACPKRSGAGNLLFADMSKDNRCFDPICFQAKSNISFVVKVKEVIETKPEIHIIAEGGAKVPVELHNDLQKLKIKILREYTDFRNDNYSGNFQLPAKGLWLTSYNQGKVVNIWLKGKAASPSPSGEGRGEATEDPKTIIAGIQQRTKRSAELDGEKVYARILETIEEHPTQKVIDEKLKAIPSVEDIAMLMIVVNYADFHAKNDIEKKLKLSTSPEKLYKQLQELSYGEITWMIRRAFYSRHSGNWPKSDEAYVIRKMAESYKDIPIAQYEKEQKDIRDRREERAKQRIAALQPKKKSLPAGRKVNGKKIKLPVKGKVIKKKKAA